MDAETHSGALGFDFEVDGVAVRDRFLPPAQVHSLRLSARERRARGEFETARIGSGGTLQYRTDIRGDSTCWIAPPLIPAEQSLLDALEQLRLQLNRESFLGLLDLELHYACYPPGAGYAQHVDQPFGRQQRKVSLALYLNEEWRPDDAGELRIFDADGRYRDVEPIGGRLVYFLTSGRKHAVLPTRRHRRSVTGWFRARD